MYKAYLQKKCIAVFFNTFLLIAICICNIPVLATDTGTTPELTTKTAELLEEYYDDGLKLSQFCDNTGHFCFAFQGYDNVVNVYKVLEGTPVKWFSANLEDLGQSIGQFGTAVCDCEGNCFLIWGSTNPNDNPDTNTIFVSKYNPKGILLKTTAGNGSEGLIWYYSSEFNTKKPFYSGNCDAAINGNILLVNYARGMYNGHQSNGLFAVYTDTMEPITSFEFYQSHSFDQKVSPYSKTGGFLLESRGDCFERGFTTAITNNSKKLNEMKTFDFWVKENAYERYNMYDLNKTYSTLGNILETEKGVALIGSSVRSLSSAAESEPYDVFIQIFDPLGNPENESIYVTKGTRDGMAGKNGNELVTNYGVQWLTNLSDTGYYTDIIQAITTDSGKIVILYDTYTKYHSNHITWYIILDKDGNILQSSTPLGDIELNSMEDPIFLNGTIQWATTSGYKKYINLYSLQIEESPYIISQPNSITATMGETARFDVSSTGSGLIFQWQYKAATDTDWKNNTTMEGCKTASLFVPVTIERNGYQYRCMVTNSAGNVTYSHSATLSVLGFKTQPVSITATLGTISKFKITAIGSGLTYQWQYKTPVSSEWKNNSTLEGCTTPTLSVPATIARNGYQYRCKVIDRAGNIIYSNAATLTVKVPLTITGHPKDVTALMGDTAKFTATATGSDLSYQWQFKAPAAADWKNNTTMSGCTTAVLSVPVTAARNGYQYRCKVADGAGNIIYSNAATLTVKVPLTITSHPKDVTAFVGDTAKFTVTATGSDLSYQWQFKAPAATDWKNNTTMSGCTTAVLSVPVTAARNGYQYRCIVTSGTESVESNPVTLMVKTVLILTAQPQDVTAAVGDTAKFTVTATGNNLSYQWQYKAATGTTWANTSMTGNKTATLSVSATAGRNGYQYRCVVTSGTTGVTSNAATLTVKAALAITAQPQDVTATVGDTAKFIVTATGSNLAYQWQYKVTANSDWKNNTTMAGCKTAVLSVPVTAARNGYQYRCMITSGTNVVYSNVATLMVKVSGPVITGQPQNVTASVGDTAKFTVIATGSGLTYQWQYKSSAGADWKDNTTMAGCKTATLTVPATAARNGYQYRCVVTSGSNVITSDAATLTVKANLAITSQPKSVTASVGDTAKFTVTATGSNLTYQWQYKATAGSTWKDNTTMAGCTTAMLTVPAAAARNGYQYRCVVTSGSNVITSDAATLTVKANLAITSQPKSVIASVGEIATFAVTATGSGLTYQWESKAVSGEWGNTSNKGNQTASITVPVTAVRNGNSYRCKVTDSAGNIVYSDAAALTVKAALAITGQPKSVTASVGETAKFSVTATGSGLSYQWQYKAATGTTWANTSMTGNKTATLSVSTTAGRNGYQYRCVVTSGTASVTSSAATLTVKVALAITTQPKSVTAVVGDTAEFTVAATGDNLTYQWQYKAPTGTSWASTSMTGNKTATLSVSATTGRDGYQYRCVVTSGTASVTSDFATLTVINGGTCGTNLNWAFNDDTGVLSITGNGAMTDFASYNQTPWYEYRSDITAVVFPVGITSIGAYAFNDCSSLIGVSIPKSVTSINRQAFKNCSSLTNITIPDGVTSIGDGAFSNCGNLTSAKLGDSVTSVGIQAFYNCSNLKSINIPSSVTDIGDWAFSSCSSLTSLDIPDGVTSIGVRVFYNCKNLTSIRIPDSVTSVGEMAFAFCSNLTHLTLGNSVTVIGDSAFRACSSLTSVCIPDSVTTIDDRAFWGCDGMTNVSIPDNVSSIGSLAFSSCSSLTSVSLPNRITSIGNYIFYQCSNLKSVFIPASVTTIGQYVFYSTDLKDVYYGGSEMDWIFVSIGSNAELTGATIHYSIDYFGTCGTDIVWGLSSKTGILSLSGSGAMTGYSVSDAAPWYEYRGNIKYVSFSEGITAVGTYAFYNCDTLKRVILPEGITTIEGGAFRNCTGLTNVIIPHGVTKIGIFSDYGAFEGCSNLKLVCIPASITTVEQWAFSSTGLTDVYYSGSETDWAKITIGSGNSKLTGANIHYDVSF